MAAKSTNPARGMRDFLPADVRKREFVIGVIKEVYESYGFEPLETPAVENLETLTGKYGEEGNQLIYKILKRGEKLDRNDAELADLALRYDLTVPLARVVANYKNDLPKFFKRYQIQPVWRADRPARGRFREFYQCDVDTIGSRSMLVEAEQISAVCEILERLGFEDFVVRVNHRFHLEQLMKDFEVPTESQSDVLVTMDKLDKIGADGVSEELSNRGIHEKTTRALIAHFKSIEGEFAALDKFGGTNEEYNEGFLKRMQENVGEIGFVENGLDEVEDIVRFVSEGGYASHIRIDPTLARGLSYYTGTIMEINVPDLAGSLGGGGRYDSLIGMFGKEEIPACGFSLGLERILVVMEERGMFPPEIAESKAADVMVTIWNEESIGESLKLANELREKGLRVLVYPEADKLGKQFKYADSLKIDFVCVLGETELAENKVTLKNMKTGEQETVNREEVAAKIL